MKDVVCVGGPNHGQTYAIRDDLVNGDSVAIRQPLPPFDPNEPIYNPFQSEEAWQEMARRVTAPMVRYCYLGGVLKFHEESR